MGDAPKRDRIAHLCGNYLSSFHLFSVAKPSFFDWKKYIKNFKNFNLIFNISKIFQSNLADRPDLSKLPSHYPDECSSLANTIVCTSDEANC